MTEFRFDFVVEDKYLELENIEESLKTTDVKEETKDRDKGAVKAEELILDLSTIENNINPDDIDVISVGDIEIKYINSTGIEAEVRIEHSEQDNKTDEFAAAISRHLDLSSGIYEGGLKVWECCLDLAEFLAQENTSWNNLNVLELGCGAGIPGLYLLLHGAVVHFQDYNVEVLERLTVPNALMNLNRKDEDNQKKEEHPCRYFAGDWSDMTSVLKTDDNPNKYDVILTSETIYNVEYYERLHELLAASLKPTGCVYVAAKTHYFGVGGGTRIFEDFINKKDVFNISRCWKNKEGLQREILKLEYKQSKHKT